MEAKTLALYLGCECTEAGLSSRGNTLVEVAFDGYETSSIRTPQGSILNIKTTRIKPILRPLSSMTEEEAREYLLMRYNALTNITVKSDKNGFWYSYGDKLSEIIIKRKFIFHGQIRDNNYPQQFQYLLSKQFDLFELIEKGEAIDSTKL